MISCAASPRRGPLRLDGVVLDEDRQPTPGARVWLDDHATHADAAGRFAFDQLPAGVARLAARHGDQSAELMLVTLRPDRAPVTVVMRRGVTVHVAATDGDGAAVVGAAIRWGDEVAALTDARGRAAVRGVGPGFQLFELTAAGHAPATISMSAPVDPGGELHRAVALAPARDAAVTGIVLTPDGAVAAGATVRLEGDAFEKTTADDRGAWRLPAIAAGRYRLAAHHPLHAPSAERPLDHDGVTTVRDLTLVLTRGGALDAAIRDDHGRPVPGATLVLAADAPFDPTGIPLQHAAAGDAEGRVSLRGLPAATYLAFAHSGDLASPLARLRVDDDATVTATFAVTFAALRGRVVDSQGAPIEGAEVRACDHPHGSFELRAGALAHDLRGDLTCQDGRFDLGAVPPGDHAVMITAPGQHHGCRPEASATVTAGAPEVTITLPCPATVTGRVLLDGAPLPAFAVSLSSSPWHPSHGAVGVHAADGRFAISGVLPGRWHLTLGGPGARRHRIADLVVAEGATVDLGDLTLTPGRAVVGVVRTAAGAPVAGAHVAIGRAHAVEDDPLARWLDGHYQTTTDDDGAFALAGVDVSQPANPRPDTIKASHPAHGVSSATPVAEGDAAIALIVAPTGSLRGALAAPRDAYTSVFVTVDREVFIARLDHAGDFRLDDLPPDRYRVVAQGRGGALIAAAEVTIVAGETARICLTPRVDLAT